MSISESYSLVNQSIRTLYLATCEGDFCAPVETVSNLKVLIKKGYVEVTECRSDPRSKHGAKTCKVKLAWITDKGKEIGKKQTTETYYEVQKELDPFLENFNPRISVLAKYFLACWSSSILSGKADIFQRRPRYRRGGWNMLPSFDWDLKVPDDFRSVLTEGVKDELQTISKKLVDLKLAEWNKIGHNVNGWYDSETLMTIKPIATAILMNYGGFEMPLFIKSLVLSISRAAEEAKLARYIENGGLSIGSIVNYLNYGSFHDVEEFLKTIENLGYANVNWALIQKYARPRIHYDAPSYDEINKEAVYRNLYGLIPSIGAIASLRYSMVFDSVKKALAHWFETGNLYLVEIPPFRMFWDAAKREERKSILPYLNKL